MSRLAPEFSLRALRAATGFLTVLPVLPNSYPPDLLPRSAVFFPLVGALVGAFGAGALVLTAFVLPAHFAAAGALLTTILLTGALHEDGLADSADGLFGGRSAERRIEIMRDSRIGTFGAIALFFGLLIRWMAIVSLVSFDQAIAVVTLVLAHATGRLSCVIVAAVLDHPPGSADHKSGRFIGEFPLAVAFPSLLLIAVAAAFTYPWEIVLGVTLVPLSLTILLIPFFKRRLGGVNGDCLGAANQLAEIAFYLTLLAMWTGEITV